MKSSWYDLVQWLGTYTYTMREISFIWHNNQITICSHEQFGSYCKTEHYEIGFSVSSSPLALAHALPSIPHQFKLICWQLHRVCICNFTWWSRTFLMLDVAQVVMVHNPSIGFLRRGLQMAVVWNTLENMDPHFLLHFPKDEI